MRPTIRARYEAALAGEKPVTELRQVAADRLKRRTPRQVYDELGELLEIVRERGAHYEEDEVLDCMDLFTEWGDQAILWCRPII